MVLATAAAGNAANAQQGILDDPTRPEADRARDPGSHPLEVYEWIGIGAGMVVADLMPFAGYNSHLLGHVVTPTGRVLAPWAFSDDAVARLRARFSAAGLDNVEPMRDVSGVPDDSVDVWLTVRNLHDLFIPAIGEQFGFHGPTVLAEIRRTLKPGGILGVVDARTPEDGLNDKTHRLNEDHAVRLLEGAGFELVDSSEMLAVEGDDYTAMGFPTRYDVDRFLLKFRKPLSRLHSPTQTPTFGEPSGFDRDSGSVDRLSAAFLIAVVVLPTFELSHFQVSSMAKKWSKTARVGLLRESTSGLRM